jgi:uncharacterized protein (DUF885 family)
MRHASQLVTFACILPLLAACGQREAPSPQQAGAPATADQDSWTAFTTRFVEEWFEAHPLFAVQAGRHEYDGKFPDWSAAGIEREITRLMALRREAAQFDGERLNPAQRFERDYLLVVIDRNLFWMDKAEWPFRNPDFYFDWISDSIDPDPYLTRPYKPLPQRMAAYTEFARNLPAALEQIRANLRTPMPRSWVEKGHATFNGMAAFLRDDVPGVFAELQDEDRQEAFAAANEAAVEALQTLADWFDGLRPDATEDFALGAELFAEMLRETERVDVPLDELERVGREDLERNLRALDEACEAFAPGTDRIGCMAKMNANKPEDGPVQAARRQLESSRRFVVEQGVASIPAEDPIGVEEAPPYARSNFAYISIPGPYDLGMPSTYYIAPPDPSWPEEEQRAYLPGQADLMSTSVHEVWPGHFLQFLHSNRAGSSIGRLFVGYAFAEGWAHYAEEAMWELGYDGGLAGGLAEFRVGQVNKALYRNVRFLCAIGLHTGGMSVAECERMFQEQALQDPGNARQQAARGTYDPAYLNYTLGKLMIRKLREEWSAERGGRSAWGEFHDAFLSYGGPPVPQLRSELLGEDAGPAL